MEELKLPEVRCLNVQKAPSLYECWRLIHIGNEKPNT